MIVPAVREDIHERFLRVCEKAAATQTGHLDQLRATSMKRTVRHGWIVDPKGQWRPRKGTRRMTNNAAFPKRKGYDRTDGDGLILDDGPEEVG